MLIISESAMISPKADIEDSIRGTKIVVGDRVRIDSFVKIKPVGGTGDIQIGQETYINSGTVIYSGNGVHIGQNVLIGPNCTIAPTNHEFRDRKSTIATQRFMPSKGGVVIGDDVWIGANTVILDGAVIGKGCVIGASSLVAVEVDEYGVYAGNPLVKIGERQ